MLYEHGIIESRRRLEGESLSWATLTLQTTSAYLDEDRWWVLGRLRVKNESRRTTKPLLISWWVKLPPGSDSVAPRRYKMWNVTNNLDDIRPGQETEFSFPIVIDQPVPAVFIHIDVYFQRVTDGEECIIAPRDDGALVDAETLSSQPRVCIRDSTTPVLRCRNEDNLCSVERTETIVPLRGLTEQE